MAESHRRRPFLTEGRARSARGRLKRRGTVLRDVTGGRERPRIRALRPVGGVTSVRTSTIVLIILNAACACATSQDIDIAGLKALPSDTATNDGAVTGPSQDGSGGLDTSSGGFPSTGGF